MKNKFIDKMFVWLAIGYHKLNKHVNLLMGSLAGVVTGSVVFFINFSHGFYPAIASFFKQFAFNMLMGGFNMRLCEKLVRVIQKRIRALLCATLIPALQAFILLYAIHYFGRTPKPIASTIWQLGLNLMIFFFLAVIYRNMIEKDIDIKTLNRKTVANLRQQGLMKIGYRKRVS